MSFPLTTALQPIDHLFPRGRRSFVKVPSLEDMCCDTVVVDANLTKRLDPAHHAHLYPRLMAAALLTGRSRDVVEPLLTTWPRRILSLGELRSHLYDKCDVLFARPPLLNRHVNLGGLDILRPLIAIFLDLIKSKTKTSPLSVLDLRGFPLNAALLEHLLQELLSTHDEFHPEYNDTLQSAMDQTGSPDNASTQNSVFEVYVDCVVYCDNAFRWLRHSLELRSIPAVRLRISKFESYNIDFQLMLGALSPEDLTGLCLCYVAGSHDGQLRLLQRFHRLHSLSLKKIFSRCSFTDPQPCEELGVVLGLLPKLRRLDLSCNNLKDSVHLVLGPIADAKLEFLDLSTCGLSGNDLAYLAQARSLGSLLELKLNKNHVLSEDLSVTLVLLESVTLSLHLLEIALCEFADSQLEPLVTCFLRMRHLIYLNICNDAFTSASVCAFVPSLAVLPDLECVRLWHTTDCYDKLTRTKRENDLMFNVSSRARTYRQKHRDLELEFMWR